MSWNHIFAEDLSINFFSKLVFLDVKMSCEHAFLVVLVWQL